MARLWTTLACAATLGAACAAAQPARPPTPRASRPAAPRCTWEPLEGREAGLRLLVQRCDRGADTYVLSFRGPVLERHRPANDTIFGGHYVLEVFTKPADQPIEEAIRERFVLPLEPEARAGCEVRPVERWSPRLGEGKVALTIVATGAYRAALADPARGKDFGCGDHGEQDETTYFEYHPAESRTRYAHVVYGWSGEPPLFDERSLLFRE